MITKASNIPLPLYRSILFIAVLQYFFIPAKAQQQLPLTIVYNITVEKNNGKADIEETYNGGTKTIFTDRKKARIRLTTLMRIQSIFIEYDSSLKKATVLKESGKNKYLFHLTPDNWKLYNKKYDNAICDTSFTDSTIIKGYACRKAVLKTGDDNEVTLFYTDSITINNSIIEPLFSCVPGTVLQYEIASSKGILRYTATEISTGSIDPSIFAIPSKSVTVKKYSPNKKPPMDRGIIDVEGN